MDGYDVLTELSKTPDTSGIPFIFLSAKTEHKDVRRGMDLGAILNENRIFLRGFQKTKKDRNNKKHGNILAIK